MQVWRICRARHVPDAFSGVGAEKTGGRWNHKGHRVVYTSSSLSLAALELFVHLEPSIIPDDLVAVSATIPEQASQEVISTRHLPTDWRDFPAPTDLQDVGTRWLRESRSLVLVVPSAVNPVEANYLLNPAHPEVRLIRDIQSRPFEFDPRMWKSASG